METNKVIKTYSINREIAEKFNEQTPDQKTSEKLEKLMAEHIDEDVEEKLQLITLLDRNIVSDQRCSLVNKIVENSYWGKTGPQIFKKLKAKGMYQGDSGSYHFKEAMKFLEQYEESFISREKSKIVATQFRCMNEGCDAEINLKILGKNDLNCPECGRGYEV